jgi:DtxR family Mn-dependent transcriptional regulator
MLSSSEENYLKVIYKLAERESVPVSTNAIAEQLTTTPASVSDMIRKLNDKGLLHYARYKGVRLSDEGKKVARNLIRKHRLWEVFLVQTLGMRWDEIHEIAEQLEHINSNLLVQRLDEFLGFPKTDPHGDFIPDGEGYMPAREEILLSSLESGQSGCIIGVLNDKADFLQYLSSLNLELSSPFIVIDKRNYDKSIVLRLMNKNEITLSNLAASSLIVELAD